MLINPFTPSEIASQPSDFFGRFNEIRVLERSLMQGSVAIRGAIGIGKSSLLARVRLAMEGFETSHKSISVVATGHKEIITVDDAARLLLESFVDIDERSSKVKFNIGKLIEIESAEVCRYFESKRHLSCLTKILRQNYIDMMLKDKEYLILGIDEADRCPIPLARMIRALQTHIQQEGVKNIRFILAGTSPYFQKMVNEDQGLNRFFYKVLTLLPMQEDEAFDLIESKLEIVIKDAEKKGIDLKVNDSVIDRVVSLSGGHPHVLQLLGSHLVEHENADPDGIIDTKDLVTSLRTICYEDRAYVYDSTLHQLELYGHSENLIKLFEISEKGFPTRIIRQRALEVVGRETLEWLVKENILSPVSDDEYRLVDEFLKIRMIMDQVEAQEIEKTEKYIIEKGSSFSNLYGEDYDEFNHDNLDDK